MSVAVLRFKTHQLTDESNEMADSVTPPDSAGEGSPSSIRRARTDDAPAVTACVCEAYLPYVERIGRQPAPMLADYAEVIEHHEVHVAVQATQWSASSSWRSTEKGFCLDNVAVRPSFQGKGSVACSWGWPSPRHPARASSRSTSSRTN